MNDSQIRDPATEPGRFWPSSPIPGDQFIKTSAGAVFVHREGSGQPLLLLHSNGHSWREFAISIEMLAEDFEVIAWDMPGQGWSDPIHPRTSIDSFADLAIEVLDALGIERAYVAGSSVGAFIAASLARRAPGRVLGASVIEFQLRSRRWWADNWASVEAVFAIPSQAPELIAARLNGPIDETFVARWNACRELAGSRAMMGVMWAIRVYDMVAALGSVEHRLQVVCGAQGLTLASRDEIEALVPDGSEIKVVENAGHFVAIDQPTDFARCIRALPGLDG